MTAVQFNDVKSSYLWGSELRFHFSVSPKFNASDSDWCGLYLLESKATDDERDGWGKQPSSNFEAVNWMWVKGGKLASPSMISFDLSNCHLFPVPGPYCVRYMSSTNVVWGQSPSFNLRKATSEGECNDGDSSEDDFVDVSDMLETMCPIKAASPKSSMLAGAGEDSERYLMDSSLPVNVHWFDDVARTNKLIMETEAAAQVEDHAGTHPSDFVDELGYLDESETSEVGVEDEVDGFEGVKAEGVEGSELVEESVETSVAILDSHPKKVVDSDATGTAACYSFDHTPYQMIQLQQQEISQLSLKLDSSETEVCQLRESVKDYSDLSQQLEDLRAVNVQLNERITGYASLEAAMHAQDVAREKMNEIIRRQEQEKEALNKELRSMREELNQLKTWQQQAYLAYALQNELFQRQKGEDAFKYNNQIKLEFASNPSVYDDYMGIIKEFTSQQIDTLDVIQRLADLFRGHNDLIVGFNAFLPLGYKIEIQSNDVLTVHQPDQAEITMSALGARPAGGSGGSVRQPPNTLSHASNDATTDEREEALDNSTWLPSYKDHVSSVEAEQKTSAIVPRVDDKEGNLPCFGCGESKPNTFVEKIKGFSSLFQQMKRGINSLIENEEEDEIMEAVKLDSNDVPVIKEQVQEREVVTEERSVTVKNMGSNLVTEEKKDKCPYCDKVFHYSMSKQAISVHLNQHVSSYCAACLLRTEQSRVSSN